MAEHAPGPTSSEIGADSPALADEAVLTRSAYVHVPFCSRICPYCDFAVVERRQSAAERYVAALRAEIASDPEWGRLDAVFFGGGTPSSIEPELLRSVLDALVQRFGLAPDAEITLEANPEDWSADRSDRLRAAGFTRVSFGGQSYDGGVLRFLGRRHSPDDIDLAVSRARESGFGSVSVDLIFGTPGESIASWEATIRRVLAVDVDHVSTYALTVESPTALGRAVRNGAPGPDADDQADKWELACELLGAAGLIRYEVSNHARPGHHCRYNMAVWAQGEYLAFGMGAHRYRDEVRSHNVRRLETYIDRVERGIGPVQSSVRATGWSAEQERLMLGLRRTAGVLPGTGGVALVRSESGRRLMEAGVLDLSRDRRRLVVVRPLLTDEVIRAVLDLDSQD